MDTFSHISFLMLFLNSFGLMDPFLISPSILEASFSTISSPLIRLTPIASGFPCVSSIINTTSPGSTPSEASTIPGLMMSAPLLTNLIAPISTVTVLASI